MKKTAIIVLAIIMVVCIGVIGVFAADNERKRECKYDCTTPCETQNCSVISKTQDCTAVCETQNCENKSENCANYEDADNDGVCDNSFENCEINNDNCVNYEDVNNDGVCDNYSENCDSNKENCVNYNDVHNNHSYGKHNGNGKHGNSGCH